MPLGEFLRKLRGDRNIGLREVARQIKCSPGYLSKVENEKEIPSEIKIIQLADFFGVDPTVMLALAGRLSYLAVTAIQKHPHAFSKLLNVFMEETANEDVCSIR